MAKHSGVQVQGRVCNYRKTSEGNGDATLPGMSVWSRSRIAGPKSTSAVSAKVQVSM